MKKIDCRKLGALNQVVFVKELISASGKDKGSKILDVNNGCLRFTILADHALDIAELSYKGNNYSFISKAGQTNSHGKGYDHLVDNFGGGMVYTCGLDAIGGVAGKRMHGSIHWTPAEHLSITCNEEEIVISGEMFDGALFNQSAVLRRTIRTKVFSGSVFIEDEIMNKAYTDLQYSLLYHVNFGWPFLDETVRINADIVGTVPVTDHASKYIADIYKSELPIDGQFEKVYTHTIKKGEVVLSNSSGMQATVQYNEKEMPYLVEWKSMTSGDYALGIEPATTKLGDNGTPKILKSGKTDKYFLNLIFEHNEE